MFKEGEPGGNEERRNPVEGLSGTDSQKHGGGDGVPFRSSGLNVWGYGLARDVADPGFQFAKPGFHRS